MTDRELSEPLVPPEVDLTDFQFMPLFIERLKKSKAWLACKRRPELAYYLVNLWMRAWHERPAGSIEADDDVLADAAMCDHRKWPKLKTDLLRGWVECRDGRLYHKGVSELANNAWAEKLAHRARTREATEAKKRKRLEQEAIRNGERGPSHDQRNDTRDDQRNDNQGRGKGEGQGKGEGEGRGSNTDLAHTTASTGAPAESARAGRDENLQAGTACGQMAKALREQGVTGVSPGHPTVVGWEQSGVTVPMLLEAVTLARDKKPKPMAIPVGYLEPIVADLGRGPARRLAPQRPDYAQGTANNAGSFLDDES